GALEKVLGLIRSAERQINLQSYTLGNQGAGRIISDELVRKASEGVEVNILLNADTQYPTSPIGTLRLKLNELLAEWTRREPKQLHSGEIPESLVKSARQAGVSAGISVVLFNGRVVGEAARETKGEARKKTGTEQWLYRLWASRKKEQESADDNPSWLASFQGPGGLPALPLLDYAVHEKILVVDGQRAVVGGRNLEEQYFSRWSDLDLYLEGPIVGEIQKGFLRSYEQAMAQASLPRKPALILPGEGRSQVGVQCLFVQSRPWDREYHALQALVSAIQSCRETFYATSQYLVLPEGLLHDALKDAALRGVDVRILMNSARTAEEVSLSSGYFLSLNYLEPLLDAGVRVWEKTGVPEENVPQPYLHAKEFILDGELLAAGSFNLSLRSSYIESENLVFVWDQELARARQRNFMAKLGYEAREITPARLEVLAREHKTRIEWSRYLELFF
ncbi:MAG: phosphatidylserine/phosphatidylglycerophosphate/cardiolipin synthase family protein, partial [Pseudomonadota bacterium]